MTEQTEQLPHDAIAALEQGNKIRAIKAVREASGCQLMEAKQRVEAYVKSNAALQMRMQQSNQHMPRAGIWLALLIVIGLIVYFAR